MYGQYTSGARQKVKFAQRDPFIHCTPCRHLSSICQHQWMRSRGKPYNFFGRICRHGSRVAMSDTLRGGVLRPAVCQRPQAAGQPGAGSGDVAAGQDFPRRRLGTFSGPGVCCWSVGGGQWATERGVQCTGVCGVRGYVVPFRKCLTTSRHFCLSCLLPVKILSSLG